MDSALPGRAHTLNHEAPLWAANRAAAPGFAGQKPNRSPSHREASVGPAGGPMRSNRALAGTDRDAAADHPADQAADRGDLEADSVSDRPELDAARSSLSTEQRPRRAGRYATSSTA